MKISIVTIVKNNRRYIKGCIQSVLKQSYQDIEHIIVDGGSIDGTLEVVNSYGDKISKVVRGKDSGLYVQLNGQYKAN